MSDSVPNVLMVTGAYFPEASGAGLQCRALIRACGRRARFEVLTTAIDENLPADDSVDDVPVHRVHVSATSRPARVLALPRLATTATAAVRRADVVHLHGFSSKSRVVMAIARRLGRPVAIKLTSAGHDDAVSMKQAGGAAWRAFRRADRFIGISPRFETAHREALLPAPAFRFIPNGVDTEQFRPAAPAERAHLRRELGLPLEGLIVLVVGFFSREKRPHVAFEAWAAATQAGLGRMSPPSSILFVGRTTSPYHEIDPGIARGIRDEAMRLGCGDRVTMIEQTDAIERFYRAADVFMLPSTREGLPNVLLEAMASGLACIVSRLPGVTDWLIDDGRSGALVDPEDPAGYAGALTLVAGDAGARARLGAEARRTIAARFSLERTATAHLALYEELRGMRR